MLKEDVKTVNTSSFRYFIQDKNSELNASDILSSSTKDENKRNKQGPFWSRLILQNDSNKSRILILYNPLPGTNYVDIYLYQKGILKKSLLLGDMREQKNRDFLNRYSAFELRLLPNEKITIISKVSNFNVVNITWTIQEHILFMEEQSKFLILFSLVGGVFIFFMIVSFIYYLFYKKLAYLMISLFILNTFLYQFAIQGVFYTLDIGINLELNTLYAWIAVPINYILLLLFTYFFFDMKQKYKKSSYFLKFLIFIEMLLILAIIYALFFEESYFVILTPLLGLFFYIPTIFLIIIGLSIREVGNKYYILGQVIVLVAGTVHTLSIFQFIEFHNYYRYIMSFSVMVDILLLFIAQSLKTQKHLKELYQAKVMLIEQSRFASMGQAIGHITHQWKHPLTLLGTSVTLMETILRHDRKNTLIYLEKELPSMTHSVEHMKNTMIELSHYYSGKLERIAFLPKKTINNSIALLYAKRTLKNAKITIDIAEDLEIINYEYIFSNIIIVLIDNSLDEFNDKNENKIHISITSNKENHTLIYSDNAGGIKIKPIEKIFEYFVSSKEKTEGQGIGLAMVKMLVEERLDGTISVKNIDDGVVFRVVLIN